MDSVYRVQKSRKGVDNHEACLGWHHEFHQYGNGTGVLKAPPHQRHVLAPFQYLLLNLEKIK